MVNCLIVRFDEIVLKSVFVRNNFRKIIIKHIKRIIPKSFIVKDFNVRLLIYGINVKKFVNNVSNVFGVSSVSFAKEVELNLNIFKKEGLRLYKESNKLFRVSCQRIDKGINLRSQSVNEEVGFFIVNKTNARVSLKNYDINICFELFNNHGYIFKDRVKGFGGLPVGCQGSVLFLGDDINSCIMMMKRGCHPIVVGNKVVFKELVNRFRFLNIKFFNCVSDVNFDYLGVVKDDWSDFKKDSLRFDVPIFYPLLGNE